METYLVIGGAGFIGSRLVQHLLERGEAVRILDNFSTGREANIARVRGDVELVVGDMRDLTPLRKTVSGVDRLILLAAAPSVRRSIEDPIGSHDVNVNGMLNVLQVAKEQSIKRVVFASSAAVYGRSTELPKRESSPPCPASPYGLHKLTGEHYCRLFRELYHLSTVSLRFFNVFGPHQNLHSEYASAVPRFMYQIGHGEQPTVFGNGEQSRDFVYVDNVVAACVLASTVDDPGSGPFNIGTGVSTRIIDLIRDISEIYGQQAEPRFAPPRPGDVLASQADISLAERLLRYSPAVSVREGLMLMAEWIDFSGDANFPHSNMHKSGSSRRAMSV